MLVAQPDRSVNSLWAHTYEKSTCVGPPISEVMRLYEQSKLPSLIICGHPCNESNFKIAIVSVPRSYCLTAGIDAALLLLLMVDSRKFDSFIYYGFQFLFRFALDPGRVHGSCAGTTDGVPAEPAHCAGGPFKSILAPESTRWAPPFT